MVIRGVLITVFYLVIASPVFAGHLHLEKEYQDAWCAGQGGVTEVVLEDKTRVDCLTDRYAVEVDFASKWAESVGQSLFYGLKTGHEPGVLLILEKDGDERYLRRLQLLADRYKIKVWSITPEQIGQTKAPARQIQGLLSPR